MYLLGSPLFCAKGDTGKKIPGILIFTHALSMSQRTVLSFVWPLTFPAREPKDTVPIGWCRLNLEIRGLLPAGGCPKAKESLDISTIIASPPLSLRRDKFDL